MRIRWNRTVHQCRQLVLILLLAPGAALLAQQDLIVDILTTPNNFWNKPVTLKGHVVRVTPDPPGTSRGRFTFRDQSDRDIEVMTSDLPAGSTTVRSAAMKPPAERSNTSRACCSGTPSSCSAKGPPGIRSPLTTRVCPTRAHSMRICGTVAFVAVSHTRPSWIDN